MTKTVLLLLLIVALEAPASAALKTNDSAPDFSLPDVSNKQVSLADLIGTGNRRGVVVSFFASWCVPCREELPILNSLVAELNEKGIAVAIIGVREDHDTIGELLRELHVDRPVVLSDRAGKTAERYQIRFLPVTFLIGADGTIKDIVFGQIRNASELRKSAEKLMH